jgi:hypothetical protein
MKKSKSKPSQAEFEDELLTALRAEMEGPQRAAARVQVSKQLQATFVGLDLGIAKLASLPHTATTTPLKVASVKATVTKVAVSAPAAAKATFAGILPALGSSANPIATLVATFAVGAAAGTGIMVASEITQRAAPAQHAVVQSSTNARAPQRATPSRAARRASAPEKAAEPEPQSESANRDDPQALAAPTAPKAASAKASASSRATVAKAVALPRAAQSETSPLAAQQSLLEEARRALVSGDTEGALRSLGEHERAFTSTLLEEERLSLKIKSLKASGRESEAQALASDFAARFPRSLLLPSIRAALAVKNP